MEVQAITFQANFKSTPMQEQQLCCSSPSLWQPTPKLQLGFYLSGMALRFCPRFPGAEQSTAFLKTCSCFWSDFQAEGVVTTHHKMKSCRIDARLQPRQVQLYQPLACLWEKATHFGKKQAYFLWSTGTTTSFKAWGCRHQGTFLKNFHFKKQISTCDCTCTAIMLDWGRWDCLLVRDTGGSELSQSPASTQKWVVLGTSNISASSLTSLWSTEKCVAMTVWRLCTPRSYQLWQSN